MNVKQKHGLGRGLDALLAVPGEPSNTNDIDIHLIDPNPKQPRKQFDEEKLKELSSSIREHGILQPLLLVKDGERYLLVAGERRWRAARMAGLRSVPALVREYTGQQIAEISLVENLQRDDLNPLEEARGIRSLLETFELTQEQVADRLSMSRPAVTNALRLLSLPDSIQAMLTDGLLSAGHVRALAAVEDPRIQLEIAQRAADNGLSVREVEQLVKNIREAREEEPRTAEQERFPELKEFEDHLMRALGTKVKINGNPKRGSIIVEYYNRKDLERLYELTMNTFGDKKQQRG